MKAGRSKAERETISKSGSQPISAILSRRLQEGGFIIFFAIAIFLWVALVTYHEADPGWSHTATNAKIRNAAGQTGAWFADLCLYLFGYLAYMFPAMTAYGSFRLLQNRVKPGRFHRLLWGLRVIGFLVAVASGCGLASLHFGLWGKGMPVSTGGICGQIVAAELNPTLGHLGSTLVLAALFLAGITLTTGLSWFGLMDVLVKRLLAKSTECGSLLLKGLLKLKVWIATRKNFIVRKNVQTSSNSNDTFAKTDRFRSTPSLDSVPITENSGSLRTKKEPVIKEAESVKTSMVETKLGFMKPGEQKSQGEQIDQKKQKESKALKWGGFFKAETSGSALNLDVGLPSVDLLEPSQPSDKKASYSASKLEALSREVETRLLEFGVQVSVVAVYPGPVITRFELELAPGLKVSKITGLSKDLARALSVNRVRVVEVIPGKSFVGLEIPNEQRELVRLREIVESPQYNEAASHLSLALGKDIAGNAMVVNLSKMPHLLVAGTTGSGKSVGINAMLLSLLYKSAPEDVRLILIDPKMLELSIYDGIPHLLTPVVTDMKDAANALRWCVAEMERRYQLMAALGVRNVAGYNHKIQEGKQANQPLLDPLWRPGIGTESERPSLNRLPYVVVIIDEFADMMMVVGKKVEELIARIAQKARAAGIHLILATQRPSVDVITGLIKANVPTRIAFQVSSRIDSRTILDQQGAEQLLGHGDMLYLAPGSGVPIRIHGAFVSDEEVHAVVKALKQFGEPDYAIDILSNQASTSFSGGQARFEEEEEGGEQDDLYDAAVQIVSETRRASISHLQRRLKIGYNRAARLIETMEAAGIVSNMQTNGSREVLVGQSEDN